MSNEEKHLEMSMFHGSDEYKDRFSVIIKNDDGSYTVEMYTEDRLVKTETISNHTLQYVEDCAENWVIGVIK